MSVSEDGKGFRTIGGEGFATSDGRRFRSHVVVVPGSPLQELSDDDLTRLSLAHAAGPDERVVKTEHGWDIVPADEAEPAEADQAGE